MAPRMRRQDARRPGSWRQRFRFLAFDHTVTDARFGEDVLGVGGGIAEVAAEAFDGGAQWSEVAVVALAPYTLQEMVVGHGSAGVGGEFGEQVELLGSQAEGTTGNGHGACGVVNDKGAAAIGGRWRDCFLFAQGGPDSGGQLGFRERLDNVIDGSHVEGFGDDVFLAVGGKEDDG